MERITPETSLGRVLTWCRTVQATDVHTQADHLYTYRVDGRLLRIPAVEFPAPTNDDIMRLLREAFSVSICERIEKQLELDLSFICGEVRYRAIFSKQQGKQSFSCRVVRQHHNRLDDLELPATLASLVQEPRGLLLIAGGSGQGKSTTARGLLQELNETQPLRVITIEDPIEYLFAEGQCQFEQREVGIDTASFADGIRSALRQDPNVIYIGEIRDQESILAAMQAAETGHLVLTTLHADSVPQTIDRIREFYPANEQENASALLARSLNAILCQRLVPGTDGRRVPCLEIMKRNAGTQEAISTNDLRLLAGIIEASASEGMHSFDQHLLHLLQDGRVTEAAARHAASNWNRLQMEMRGYARQMPGILKRDSDRR
ncbi:MAG: Flp pilus assembly complex ATPase component TadA [Verrucomicrobiales bacterium]|nr:Flp pilus assembly complex ATPase component TadA [Verrucomicrobiales bacterium]